MQSIAVVWHSLAAGDLHDEELRETARDARELGEPVHAFRGDVFIDYKRLLDEVEGIFLPMLEQVVVAWCGVVHWVDADAREEALEVAEDLLVAQVETAEVAEKLLLADL